MSTSDQLPGIDDIFDAEEEKKSWAKVMYPFLILGFLKGVEEVGGRRQPEQLLSGYKRQLYFGKSLDYAAKTVNTTRKALEKEISEAIDNGESVKELAGRIDDLYGESMGYRSIRIARTQLTNTIGDGTVTALIDEGNQEKEWSTVIDGRERESHHDANGQVVGIHEQFKLAGGMGMYPGDDNLPIEETAQCRCTVVAPSMSEEAKFRKGLRFLAVHGSLERRYVLSCLSEFKSERDRILSRLAP